MAQTSSARSMSAAGASSFLSLWAGFVGFGAGEAASEIHKSRARMILRETEARADRHVERSRRFEATQSVTMLKGGIELKGSPLTILAETRRIAAEDLSALRAQGRAAALDEKLAASRARARGRAAFLSGVSSAISTGFGVIG